MVVCVYLWLNCVNQSEPTHHKQSDSSRVQPPDVGGWKRWKRDSVSGWSPSLALFTRARAPVPPTLAWWIGPCVRGLLHVLLWHVSASHFYRQSMQMTSFPFSFSFFTVSPAVDAFSTVTVRGCGRRHNLHLLIITADNPEQKEAQRWPRRWSVLQTCSSDQKCLKRKTRDDCWKEPVCVDTPRSISVPPPYPHLPPFLALKLTPYCLKSRLWASWLRAVVKYIWRSHYFFFMSALTLRSEPACKAVV